MQNFNKFAKIITALAETYERDLSKELIKLYWNVLNKYTDEQFEIGVTRLLNDRTLQKFPKPAEIIRYIEGRSDTDHLTLEEQAEIAWQQVTKAMSDYGAWQSVVFEDRTIMGIIENSLGGWRDLCMLEIDKLVWKQKEFVKQYCIDKKAGRDRGVDRLIGHLELGNSENGQVVKAPIYIKAPEEIKKLAGKTEHKLLE
jgi:hypothetical protein